MPSVILPEATTYRPRRGIVTLTLRGEDGHVLQRVRAHNGVPLWVTKYGLLSLQKYWYVPVAFSNPFTTYVQGNPSYLLLLADSRPEGPGDGVAVEGVLGYGYSTNGSSGTQQGAFNSTSSYINTKQAHLVYDFTTAQANGTINSVALAVTGPSYGYLDGKLINDISSLVSSPYGVAYDGSYVWVIETTSNTIVRIDPSTWAASGRIPLPSGSCQGLAWNGTNLMVSENATNGRVYTIDRNGNVLSWFIAPGGSGFASITWDGANLWGASGNTVYKMAASGSIVATFTVNPTGYPIIGLSYIPSVGAILGAANSSYALPYLFWLLLDGTVGVQPGVNSWQASDGFSYQRYFAEIDAATWVWTNGGYGSGSHAVVSMPYGLVTRAVLPQPVVKSSSNALEVVYDIYF